MLAAILCMKMKSHDLFPFLFQELDRGEYSPAFAKHFISEGITHGHAVVCLGERVSSWLTTLPKPIEQESGWLI